MQALPEGTGPDNDYMIMTISGGDIHLLFWLVPCQLQNQINKFMILLPATGHNCLFQTQQTLFREKITNWLIATFFPNILTYAIKKNGNVICISVHIHRKGEVWTTWQQKLYLYTSGVMYRLGFHVLVQEPDMLQSLVLYHQLQMPTPVRNLG